MEIEVTANTAQAEKNLKSLHDVMTQVVGATGPEPGWRTSEYWLTKIALILTLLYASGVIPTSGLVAQVTAIAATILGALGYTVVRSQLKKAHALGSLGVPQLAPSNDNATPAPAAKQAGFIRLGLMLVIAAIAGTVLLAGCSSSARLKTATATLAGLDAVQIGYAAWEKQHEVELADAAKTRAEGLAALADFQGKRNKASADLKLAFKLVQKALELDDDPSLTNALAAAALVRADLAALGLVP